MKKPILFLLFLVFAPCLHAQQSQQPEPISDNSFLIEEAYNQEAGVVQHINTFIRTRGGDWLYTFTQEWPVRSMKHQLSYTIASSRVDDVNRGIGDTTINYRYQLKDSAKVAISPRLSFILPTGSAKKALGAGGFGIQTNLPVSVKLSDRFVTHLNAGATFTPHARNKMDQKAFTKGFNLGQSVIWLAHPRFNVMLETAWNSYQVVTANGKTETSYSWLVNPGIRWAYNFKNGLQIVPGVSVPLGIGPSRGDRGVFFYLSFEHPFKKTTEH